jgi:hypothetical protein
MRLLLPAAPRGHEFDWGHFYGDAKRGRPVSVRPADIVACQERQQIVYRDAADRGPDGFVAHYINPKYDYGELNDDLLVSILYGSTNWDDDLSSAWIPGVVTPSPTARKRYEKLKERLIIAECNRRGFNP